MVIDRVPLFFLIYVERSEVCASYVLLLHPLSFFVHPEKPIIHRDVKSSNILLTKNLRAKVADFGFARTGPTDQSHVKASVKGTFGYVDPEYLRTYHLTPKSDVFSFGILLLEVLTARRPVDTNTRRSLDERVTIRWVKHHCSFLG